MDEQCLCKAQANFQVELHPSKLHDVQDGVREHLNGLLFKYQEDLEGFVMAYHGVQIQSRHASIHPYFPYVHLDVKASVLLFKPTVGCMLVGRVIKVGTDFIGLLVLGVFNASIAADSIRPEFKCNPLEQSWVSKKKPGHEIKLGSDVRFQVVKLQEQAAFFGIFGSLLDKCTGAVEQLREDGRLSGRPTSFLAQGQAQRQAQGRHMTPEEQEQAELHGKKDKKKDKKKKRRKEEENGHTEQPKQKKEASGEPSMNGGVSKTPGKHGDKASKHSTGNAVAADVPKSSSKKKAKSEQLQDGGHATMASTAEGKTPVPKSSKKKAKAEQVQDGKLAGSADGLTPVPKTSSKKKAKAEQLQDGKVASSADGLTPVPKTSSKKKAKAEQLQDGKVASSADGLTPGPKSEKKKRKREQES